MNASPRERQKVTLTELQRYMPLPPPIGTWDLPPNVRKFLASSSFNNYSLKEQRQIKQSYDIAYRNYYIVERIVQHLNQLTRDKFTLQSLEQTVCNCAQKYQRIDWFLFTRIVNRKQSKIALKNKQQAANYIVLQYRKYLQKKRVLTGRKEVEEIKKSMQQKLIKQLAREVLKQIKELVQKNRVQMDKKITAYPMPQKMSYITFDYFINAVLQCMIENKKLKYLYLRYDYRNFGSFVIEQFLREVFTERKPVVVAQPNKYLIQIAEILQFVRNYMTQLYYSQNQMTQDYKNKYHNKYAEYYQTQEENSQDELNQYQLYHFLKDKCVNKLSFLQTGLIHKQLQFIHNLHYLYVKPNLTELVTQVAKFALKQERKRQLKRQHDNFYSFRKIILHLLSKCKVSKLTKEEFTNFIISLDPALLHKSFYCVWRVYGNLINVERMKSECKLNPLACYFKLTKSDQQYQNYIELLTDAFPPGTEVPYSKVQQKVNLYCQFALDQLQMRPLKYRDYDQVDYHKCISQILPADFELIMRAYIFRKISGKFVGIWKAIQIKKQDERRKQELMQALINKILPIPLEKSPQKKENNNKKMSASKSNASLLSKFSNKTKKSINPETCQLVKQILDDLFNSLIVGEQALQKIQENHYIKKQLILASSEHYTYRSSITRGYFHHLFGILGMGKQFLKLKDGQQQKIDIKIPYKPELQIVDFVIWGNDIALLTSYSTVQIYALGQSNNYPIRTIQFNQKTVEQRISSKLFDQICRQRFYGKYPILLKAHQQFLLINMISATSICMINRDTTKDIAWITFNYKEHFYPNPLMKLFDHINKIKLAQPDKIKFMDSLLRVVNQLKNLEYCSVHRQKIEQILVGDLQTVKQMMNNFDYREIHEFLSSFSPSILKTILKGELNLKQKYHLPSELKQIIKLMNDYMKENNFSLHEVILEVTKQQQEVILLKQFKNYLLKITYQLYTMYEKQIDKFLKNVSSSKYIEYTYLADIVGYNWNYQILEQPTFLIHNFVVVLEYHIVIYTLQGFNTIFIKNIHSQSIIAKLHSHQTTPIIHYVSDSMILVSADSKKISRDHQLELCVWRIYDDIIAVFNENPPWKVLPYYRLMACHEDSITSINYLSRSHTIVTTSLDSTIKFWTINSNPFSLSELRRIYSNDFYYLSAEVYPISLSNNQIKLQFILANKISKQISNNNIYRYETTLELNLVQFIKIKIPQQNRYFQVPVRMKDYMTDYGQKISKKKAILLSKTSYEQIKSLNKARLMLESLDKNIYNSLKTAYIFGDVRQLKLITDFLSKNQHSEMIVRNVCQQYGLDLIEPLNQSKNASNLLNVPPQLPNYDSFMKSQISELSFPLQTIQQIFDKITKNSTNNNSLIQIETLVKILTPYLYGNSEQKLNELLKNYEDNMTKSNISSSPDNKMKLFTSQYKTNKFIEVSYLRQFLKGYQIKGGLQKFYISMRMLLILLKQKHVSVWEIFSVHRKQLEKFKKIRTTQFSQKLTSLGLNKTKLFYITEYLNRNGTISLYQFIHYAKMAKEDANPSELMPNYSALIFNKSKVLQQSSIQLAKKYQQKQKAQKSLQKSSLQNQVQSRLKIRQSKLSSEAFSQDDKSKTGSLDKPNRKDISQSSDSAAAKGMTNSNSKGSLSKDITYTKDTQKRQAYDIMRKLKQLLRNEGKSLWQIIALSIPQFIFSPIIPQTQYFTMFDYLKTPFRLQQKLNLLKYIKRESNGKIDINILFELTQNNAKQKPLGEKYIIAYLIEKLQTFSLIIDQSIQLCFFTEKQQMNIDGLILIFSKNPFNCCNFVLKQFELILLQQKRSVFTASDIKAMLVNVIDKYKLKIELNKVNFINDLIYKVDKKGMILQEIFPKQDKVTLQYFSQHAKVVYQDTALNCQEDFKTIIYPLMKDVKKDIHSVTIKYSDFIKQLQRRMGKANELENKQLQICKKLVKNLQNLKITLFQFFIMIDRNKKFFITQEQLQIGLMEVNISYDLWTNIPKRNSKRLCYYQFISYLTKKNILSYKSIDSEIQIAMEKFIRRFMRSEDIEVMFNRLRGENQTNEVRFEQFKRVLKMVNYFKEEEIMYLFSYFANENVIKDSKMGNDQIIKDLSNLNKTFNYKKFIDIVSLYRSQNITKTPNYKFYDYVKKRNISLTSQFKKWLQKNKKLKEVAEALKKQQYTLSADTFLLFITQIKGGLTDKQLKDMISKNKEDINFKVFQSMLQDVYKKGNLNIEKQEIQYYLQEMIKKIIKQNVTIQRLFSDYAHEKASRMSINDFGQLCHFLSIGFNKIQIKKIFNFLDKQKKGGISYSELMDAIEQAQKVMDKDENDYKFQYTIQKLMNSKNKFELRNSKIPFNLERACITFQNVLSRQQSQMLFKQGLKQLKKQSVGEKQFEDYLNKKIFEFKLRCDKKDKQMIIKLLHYLKKINLEIEQIFNYLSKHHSNAQIKKQDFSLLYQTLELKNNLAEITSLFNYLDENKKNSIIKTKWDDKLNMIYLQQEIQMNIQNQDLKLFYKVKLFLSEVYLIFIRKSFKNHQIYHFFDQHGNGIITYDQFLRCLDELGVIIEEDMVKKVINYLDKNREKNIKVGNLLVQLENCLGSKMRLILQTKTFHLFKEKSRAFQQKSTYFINQLANREQLVEINGIYKSCILSQNLIDLLKQFGCILTEDELRDIHKNFIAAGNHLYLYPIYSTFVNLFKDGVYVDMQAAQADRYKKLLIGMIKNNYTLENLQKLNSYNELYNFIEQLGVFAPIDIKLIIEANLYQSSLTVDIQSLKQKIKNSYLTKENQQINQSFLLFANNTHTELRKQLKQKLNVQQFMKALGAKQGKINLQTFQNTLIKINVIVTKGVAKRYFQFFSQGKQYLELTHLVQSFKAVADISQSQLFGKTAMSVMGKSQVSNSPLTLYSQMEAIEQKAGAIGGSVMIAEHIVKSLNFRAVSLDNQLSLYYSNNYGYIKYNDFITFLQQIGVDVKTNEKLIAQFLQDYSLLVYKTSFTKEKLLKVQKIQAFMTESCSKYVKLQQIYEIKQFSISSQLIREWIASIDIQKFIIQFDKWLNENMISQFTLPSVYQSLVHMHPQIEHILLLFVKQIPFYLSSYQHFYEWMAQIQNQIKISVTHQKQKSTINDQPEKQLSQLNNQHQHVQNYFPMFVNKNPIHVYQIFTTNFTNTNLAPSIQCTNIQRLSINIFYEYILNHTFLLQITPNLIQSPIAFNEALQLNMHAIQMVYNLKTLNTITIDEEEELDHSGLLLINKKYYGLQLSMKYEFQCMASLANIFDPSAIFIKTRNFYMWEPNLQSLPKTAINYRWRFIPFLAKNILQQLAAAHSNGLCLPHLRWCNLNKTKLIDKVIYPCPIDKTGKIKNQIGFNSLKYEDPYCCPEFYRFTEKGKVTYKCDSWIFGCILYQFMYGHPPESFLLQLKDYIKNRHIQFSLGQVLEMEQLPYQFNYVFYNTSLLNKLFSLEHELKPKQVQNYINIESLIKRQQSFKGITFNLELIYNEEYTYYKQQFKIVEELNNIIYECLQINSSTRPSIEEILSRKLFNESEGLQDYKDVLNNHTNSELFYEQLILPIKNAFVKHNRQRDYQQIIDCIQNMNRIAHLLTRNNSLPHHLVIPKNYPWPLSVKGVYSQNIIDNKDKIRQTSNFHIVTLFYNSHYLEMVTLIALEATSPNRQILLDQLLTLINKLTITFKQYSNASCGFVVNLLETLLKLIYDETQGLLNQEWLEQTQINQELKRQRNRDFAINRKRSYLSIHNFQGGYQKRSLSILNSLVYLNGDGNTEYLPISHYILQNPQTKELIQNIYCHIRLLNDPTEESLMINYFRDRVIDQTKLKMQLKIKIEVDMLKFLTSRKESKTQALNYFKDLILSHNPNIFTIYRQDLIYLYFGYILRDTTEIILNKQIVLEIMAIIINITSFRKWLHTPSMNMIREILRLMVEPSKANPIHIEYEKLQDQLEPIAQLFINTPDLLTQIIAEIQQAEFIIDTFLKKLESNMLLKETSVIHNQ